MDPIISFHCWLPQGYSLVFLIDSARAICFPLSPVSSLSTVVLAFFFPFSIKAYNEESHWSGAGGVVQFEHHDKLLKIVSQ